MVGTNAARVEDGECEWVRAHQALSRLARERAAADAEEGRWLLAARRSAAHVHLGFGSFGEYIERLFGYTRRTVQEKLRVAEALEGLPKLAGALERGSLGWSAARELTRVAVADTEQVWLESPAARRYDSSRRLWRASARGTILLHRCCPPSRAVCCASRWSRKRSRSFARR